MLILLKKKSTRFLLYFNGYDYLGIEAGFYCRRSLLLAFDGKLLLFKPTDTILLRQPVRHCTHQLTFNATQVAVFKHGVFQYGIAHSCSPPGVHAEIGNAAVVFHSASQNDI